MTNQDQNRMALQERLVGLLRFPGESPSTDYKEAKPFSAKDDFGRKLVRHILGMANSGGGTLVIGYTERNEKLGPDPTMNPGVTASYDSTALSQTVGSYVRGDAKPILVVEKVFHDGQYYPIICIDEFSRNPFFCRSTVDDPQEKLILREGALYVRDQHTRTVEIANPAQWEELISRCVRKRQSEMLDEFGRILSEVKSGTPREETSYLKDFESIVGRERELARKRLEKERVAVGGWYFWHAPTGLKGPFEPTQLRDAAERAKRRNTGLPMGLIRLGQDMAAPAEDGLRMCYGFMDEGWSREAPFTFEHWFLHRHGGFFLYRHHDFATEKDVSVAWDLRVWRIGESIDHCLALYEALGVNEETEIRFSLVHEGLENVPLISSEPGRRLFRRYVCRAGSVSSSWSGALATLQATRREQTIRFCQELFTYFDFCEISDSVLGEVYDRFAKSRM